jgi:tRNA dimethylallyltransferase
VSTPPVLVAVVGATASGKSDLAVRLAGRLAGEVVNADAMQLYRGMDIGTAKLTPHERGGVAHHLLDVLEVSESASVAQYQTWARDCVHDIWVRHRLPLLVGGSALYVHAVVDVLDFPGTDPRVRADLEAELAVVGPAAMHARLAALDPDAAAAILPSNARRIVRALEVAELTGRPFAARLPAPALWHTPTAMIGLHVPRDVLDERIAVRVERMFERGLVAEVRTLVGQGLRDGRTASRALGYAQVLAMLDGTYTEDEARERSVAATRRFVRRQEAWLRRDPRVRWLRYDESDLVERAVSLVRSVASPS